MKKDDGKKLVGSMQLYADSGGTYDSNRRSTGGL